MLLFHSPDYNPIESAIGWAKRYIKKERLRRMIAGDIQDNDKIIKEAFNKIDKKICVKYIDHSQKLLD